MFISQITIRSFDLRPLVSRQKALIIIKRFSPLVKMSLDNFYLFFISSFQPLSFCFSIIYPFIF